jgi:6-phosphofructokinase 1
LLQERLGEDVRVTILGHVQRGGAPSAFDRTMSTLVGHAAVAEIASATPDSEPLLIGMRHNRITRTPLMRCIEQTHEVASALAAHDYDRAMELRGGSFREAYETFSTLVRTLPHPAAPDQPQQRLAVLHAGGPAPGMNTAVRAAVRLGLDRGCRMLGVQNGFQGLIDGTVHSMDWMSVSGWVSLGGAELGTSRKVPGESDLAAIAQTLEALQIDGLLIIGGWEGYQAAERLYRERATFPAFNIPIVCLPASINNNLPGSELSIGADTALNNIVAVVDKIKQSAVATQRCFVVEVMGRMCGYLALLSSLATGAERVYLPEEGITLHDLEVDLSHLVAGFQQGKRLGLMIRNENASAVYTTAFISALFEEEGQDLFEVRQAILGHLQQGGDPSPFDRIQATRLAAKCVDFLIAESGKTKPAGAFVGLNAGKTRFSSLQDLPQMLDAPHQRPREQWWMELRSIARLLAQPAPGVRQEHRESPADGRVEDLRDSKAG